MDNADRIIAAEKRKAKRQAQEKLRKELCELVNLDEVAAMLRVCPRKLFQLRKESPDFPDAYYILSTRAFFRKGDVMAWINSRRVGRC